MWLMKNKFNQSNSINLSPNVKTELLDYKNTFKQSMSWNNLWSLLTELIPSWSRGNSLPEKLKTEKKIIYENILKDEELFGGNSMYYKLSDFIFAFVIWNWVISCTFIKSTLYANWKNLYNLTQRKKVTPAKLLI